MTEPTTPDSTSADDWDEHWERYNDAVQLNPAQIYRHRLIITLLALGSAGSRVLDIGSGQGDFAARLRTQRPDVEIAGLELSRWGCEISRRKVPNALFLQCNLLEGVPPPQELAGWATHAVCSEVLEHLDHPAALLTNALPYLAPGSRLVVTVPGGPRSAFDRHIGHRRHYNRRDLRRLLEDAGFRIDGVIAAGFPFHSLYRLAVILRGRRLADDALAGVDSSSSPTVRAMSFVFGLLFRLNLPSSPWGWQLVAVAHRPGRGEA